MKLKLLLKLVEKVLGMTDTGDAPRADMYLPERLLGSALIFLAGGTACAVFAVLTHELWTILCAVLGISLGSVSLLCRKNQSIHIISDDQVTYTTMFGNTRTYAFSDIQALRKNQDSMTLFVAGEKVHIESMAVLSERLIDHINRELAKHN